MEMCLVDFGHKRSQIPVPLGPLSSSNLEQVIYTENKVNLFILVITQVPIFGQNLAQGM